MMDNMWHTYINAASIDEVLQSLKRKGEHRRRRSREYEAAHAAPTDENLTVASLRAELISFSNSSAASARGSKQSLT